MKIKPPRKDPIIATIHKLESEVKQKIEESTSIYLVDVNDIFELKLENNKYMHNRISYSKTKLHELADNIEELAKEGSGILGTGILNAVMLRRNGNRLERIHGNNRIEAVKIYKRNKVPAVILDNVSDELARFMRSSENLKREDFNPYDETLSIIEHIQITCGFESEEKVKSFINKVKNFSSGKTTLTEAEKIKEQEVSKVFERIGRFDIRTFADRLVILNLNELLKEALIEEKINYSQAKVINSKISNSDDIKKIIAMIEVKNVSIANLKKLIDNMKVVEIIPNGSRKKDKIAHLKDAIKCVDKNKYGKLKQEYKIIVDGKIDEISRISKEISAIFEKTSKDQGA